MRFPFTGEEARYDLIASNGNSLRRLFIGRKIFPVRIRDAESRDFFHAVYVIETIEKFFLVGRHANDRKTVLDHFVLELSGHKF